jgi:hypothetical protein
LAFPISCDIKHVSLKDRPLFDALSYTWGDPKIKNTITLAGCSFLVTQNLDAALHHIRSEDEERVLWIDAVCINQNDPVERGQQVQQMREIFAAAWIVLAWSGEATETSQIALSQVNKLSNVYDKLQEGELNDITERSLAAAGYEASQDWTPMFEFLNRPYWTRMWVLQELVVPYKLGICFDGIDDVMLGCGPDWIPMSALYKACEIISNFALTAVPSENLVESGLVKGMNIAGGNQTSPPGLDMCILVRFLSLASETNPAGLLQLLSLSRNLRATDLRDKVYALLGLVYDDSQKILPDYTISIEQLCMDVVLHLISKNRDLGILSGPRPKWEGSRPSWAPDLRWGYPVSEPPQWRTLDTTWRASLSSLPQVRSADDRILSVIGFEIDAIVQATCPVRFYSHPYDTKGITGADFLPAIHQLRETLTDEQREVLWRVLILDYYIENEEVTTPAPERARRAFDVLLDPSRIPDDFKPEIPLIDRVSHFTSDYIKCLTLAITNRCLFVTKSGKLGIGPYDTKLENVLAILYGGKSRYILRREGLYHIFLGDAYLYGAMNGELMASGINQEMEFLLC